MASMAFSGKFVARAVQNGAQVVSRRGLGDTTIGPQFGNYKANWEIAKTFFSKETISYYGYKQQCLSLRPFAFVAVTGGCVLALIVSPPKSSYWTFSAVWARNWSGGTAPLFLKKPANHETDVPGLVSELVASSLGLKAAAPPAAAAPEAPPAAPAPEAAATTITTTTTTTTTTEEAAPAKPATSAVGQFKVCVCGGAGGIGQPLSMLMALDERVGELNVFDLNIALVPAAGVAADLSHIERPSKVKAYELSLDQKPVDDLGECLTGCDLVLVPAGLPRKPGMTRSDLLDKNAGIAKGIVEACAKYCPNAVVALIVNPVNSVVPAMAELYRKAGKDPSKIVGVTTLDIVRANKFVHEVSGVPLNEINVPVIGGHAGETILPLFSQVEAAKGIPADQLVALDKRVQDAGTEVVNAKKGKGSATLSMAYAGARLGKAVLAGLAGEEGVEEYAYVGSNITGLPYFASKVTFGKTGVEQVHPLPPLSAHETERLAKTFDLLTAEIQAGLDYAAGQELAA